MIAEYKLNPYPRRMWVVKGESFDDIKSQFVLDKEDSELTDEQIREDWDAVVFRCTKDKYLGYLVFITDNYSQETLVHEASHITLNIYIDCQMRMDQEMDQEPFAYLVEYIYHLLRTSIE